MRNEIEYPTNNDYLNWTGLIFQFDKSKLFEWLDYFDMNE